MLLLLWFIVGIGFVIYFVARQSRDKTRTYSTDLQLRQRNVEWVQFITQYYSQDRTQAERALIESMLADLAARGLDVPQLPGVPPAAAISKPPAFVNLPGEQTTPAIEPAPLTAALPKTHQQIQLDNTSLLLYFGAFLFVASVGLFVAFGGLPGVIRTFLVMLVSAVLYVGGMQLYHRRPALRQAALTFVGIGMTIAPLIGLAAYNYLFDHSQGSLVWFLTSALCLTMYAHALVKLRQPLIGYVFIFTFLSLFESSLSIISVPLYYYGWGLALVGIGLSVYSRYGKAFSELREPSRTSATIFVPLSILASFVLLPSLGAAQLGVSLLIAASYYWLEAMQSKGLALIAHAATAQVAVLLGIASLGFAWWHSWPTVAVVMLFVGFLELIVVLWRSPTSQVWQNFATITVAAQLVFSLVAIEQSLVLLTSLVGLVVISGAICWRQKRADAYATALVAWMALPLVYGYLVCQPSLRTEVVVLLLLAALCAQLALYLFAVMHSKRPSWRVVSQYTYLVSAIVPVIVSFWSSAWWCVVASGIVSLTMVYLAWADRDSGWGATAGLISAAPLLFGLSVDLDSGAILTANLVALVLNAVIALVFRREANRWFSTFLWLLLPVTLGNGVLGVTWHAAGFAWAYFVVMVGLILSRAIARGVILPSVKVPLASFARSASLSYVFGYCFAAMVAVVLALLSGSARLHASLIIGLVTIVVFLLSEYIERRPDLLILIPLGLQALLLSVMRPTDSASGMLPFLLVSSALAVVGYFGLTGSRVAAEKQQFIRDGSLVAAFVAPTARIFTDQTYWPMPVGLLVASGIVYDRIRHTTQLNRECTGVFVLIAVYWVMAFAGVRSVQAYSHVLVALLAGYAYWRFKRGEHAQSDQYIWTALIVATGPLIIQALSGVAGGLYGWWLLLEQVAIMLIGMAIRKHFVTMWGLYVAVGAVLYQLRGLGWAALIVLAMFLIGLAVYRLQKTNAK